MIKKFDIRKYSNILVFSISLIPLILFLFIIWNRLALPFVFEWGESAGLNQIYRILSGGDLYDQPTLEFSPLVYTPLYYFLAAGASKVIGNPLFSARLISAISSIASVFLIIWIIQSETKNSLLAWISGMVYLACFALAGGFYDLARVECFFILVFIIGF
jgi:4-amino-4-deoxy-L-arabinose transferase-like glycosyltransferase